MTMLQLTLHWGFLRRQTAAWGILGWAWHSRVSAVQTAGFGPATNQTSSSRTLSPTAHPTANTVSPSSIAGQTNSQQYIVHLVQSMTGGGVAMVSINTEQLKMIDWATTSSTGLVSNWIRADIPSRYV